MFVGCNLGRNSRHISRLQVRFAMPFELQGQNYLVRLTDPWLDMMLTGFSLALRSIGASNPSYTNAHVRRCWCFATDAPNHRAPDTARCVQGGKAIIISQPLPSFFITYIGLNVRTRKG